jgi:phage tail sheath gpL-like
MPDINIGVPSTFATPGDYLQINFGVGPGGSDPGTYAILIIGNKTSSASATVDTEVYGPNTNTPLVNETDMIALGGAGCEAHRMWLRVRKVLDLAATVGVTAPPVYVIFPTESVGVAATLTFTIANTAATDAVLRFYMGDEYVDLSIASGQLIATIGANLAVAINNKTSWPITAAFATATLTITSKQAGPRGNEIRVWARIISGSPTTTITNNVSTPLASGATADSWTTALSTIYPVRFYYIVSPDTSVSGTTYDDLVTQVIAQSAPLIGIRQVVMAASVGTQASASTIAATSSINTVRAEIAQLYKSDLTAGELAATYAAAAAVFETLEWSYNFRDFGKGSIRGIPTDKFWKVPAPTTKSAWPTPGVSGSVETALNNGVTPIGVTTDGRTYITRAITTAHKNASNFDYRARDRHLRSVLDRWSDELLADYTSQFGGSTIIDDLKEGEPTPGPNVVQPKQIKALVFSKLDKYANRHLKKVSEIKAGTTVARNSQNQQRVDVLIPARVIDLLLQSGIQVNDNSTAT